MYVKHENHQILGSFKIRGAVNLLSQIPIQERRKGVIVASSGNFGQGIAYAGEIFGIDTHIVLPVNANQGKVESMKLLGAKVIFHGKDFDDARQHAEYLSVHNGYRYVHSANEPLLISGAATYSLEIIEQVPNPEIIIVPIGGGSGACGTCIVANGQNNKIDVIGVQSSNAPAAYNSWRTGRIQESKMETVAEGLATRVGFKLTQTILTSMLSDFILVSDDELQQSISAHLKYTHNLAEHAGAASLAAAIKIKQKLKNKVVVLVLSGGNITIDQLKLSINP